MNIAKLYRNYSVNLERAGGEHPSAALLGTTTPENLVLFQIVGDAEVFTPFATPLFEILDGSPPWWLSWVGGENVAF
jgi:hypothetical protein